MLDPELADERQNEILGRAEEIVTQGGGVWHGNEPWGRRKLAYEIDELSRVLRITDGAIRHMAVRRPKPTQPPTASVEATQ